MDTARPSDQVRLLGLALGAVGTATVLAADRVAAPLISRGVHPAVTPVIRLLGLRQLGQGAVLVGIPDPAVTGAGGVADVLHGASMVVLAAGWPQFRAQATASATIAGVSMVAAAVLRRRQVADPR